MQDVFKDRAEGASDLIKEARAEASEAWYINYSTHGIATCLLASLSPEDKTYPQAVIDLVSPALYERAKELVTTALHKDMGLSDTDADKEHLSPGRAWPLMLCHAIYERFGCDGNGYAEGWGGHILDHDDDEGFPLRLRDKQIELSQTIKEELYQFTVSATEMLKDYLNYPCEMNPLWFFGTIQIAGESNIEYSKGLKKWFFDCFDLLLIDVHEARARSEDQSYRKHYH